MYNAWTAERYRGQSVFPRVLASVARDMANAGGERVWIDVESVNVASRRAIDKAGFLEVARLERRRALVLFHACRRTLSRDGALSQRLLSFGPQWPTRSSCKKIAYLIDEMYSPRGGTEKQLLGVIRRLDRSRFEPTLVCLRATAWSSGSVVGCECVSLGYKGFLKPSFPAVVRRLATLIDERRFDIVQTFFEELIFVCYLASLFSRQRPILLASRRDMGLNGEPPYAAMMRSLLPWIYRRFDAVMVNGLRVRDHVRQRFRVPAERIKVIHNGVDLSCKGPSAPPLFGGRTADVWIGVVANLTPVKRHDVFLRALDLLRHRHGVDFQAVILGEGPLRAQLEGLCSELRLQDRVQFAGSVENVAAYIRHLDVAVLCSDKEGFSNSILEYMACAVPVVATDVGGNPELVDRESGICVPPGDPAALSAALAQLSADRALRQRMGLAGRQRVESTYSWERSMRELESVYQGFSTRP